MFSSKHCLPALSHCEFCNRWISDVAQTHTNKPKQLTVQNIKYDYEVSWKGKKYEKTFLSIIIGRDHILIMIYHVRAKSSVRSTGMNGGGPM